MLIPLRLHVKCLPIFELRVKIIQPPPFTSKGDITQMLEGCKRLRQSQLPDRSLYLSPSLRSLRWFASCQPNAETSTELALKKCRGYQDVSQPFHSS